MTAQIAETDPRQETEDAVRDALRGVPNLRSGRLPDHGDAYRFIEALRVAGYVVTPAADTLDSLTAERRALREALTAALDQWAMYANEERGPGPEHFDPGEPANSYLTLIENGTDPEAQKFAECRAALFEGGSK